MARDVLWGIAVAVIAMLAFTFVASTPPEPLFDPEPECLFEIR